MPNRSATFETTKGTVVAEIYEDTAPITAKNFIKLVEEGFYDGVVFHRYVQGFVVQGGDPTGTGSGGSGTTIPLEVHEDLIHDAPGMLSMARSSHPDSASSQFYFTLAAAPHLDMSYAVFGKVTDGLDNVLALRQGDRMTKVSMN